MHRFLPNRPEQIQRIGQRLRERRLMMPEVCGHVVTERGIATAAGWNSHSNVVRYENGDVVSYDTEKLKLIARVLRCSVQDFYKPPGSTWTEHKLPRRRTTAPLRMHSPTKHLDVDVRFPMKLPSLTKTMAQVRALKKTMQFCDDHPIIPVIFGANESGMTNWPQWLKRRIESSLALGTHGPA